MSLVDVRRRAARSVLVLVAVSAVPLAAPDLANAQTAPFCPPGRTPSFVFGFAALQAQLGSTMGQPTDCEHPNPANGDVLQQTTTGLAYWRPSTNIPVFTTDGTQHWALVSGAPVYWQNSSAEPPQPTPAEAAYVDNAVPVMNQVDSLLGRLTSDQQEAAAGGIDNLPVAEVGGIVDGLSTAHDDLAAMTPPPELADFHQSMLDATDATSTAASTLLRAQLTQNAVARDAFITQAAAQITDAEAAYSAARDAYSTVLPLALPR